MRKLTSLLQWLNTKFSKGATQVLVEVDEESDLVLPTPVPVIIMGAVNSGGTGTQNSATGQVPTLAATSDAILTTIDADTGAIRTDTGTIATDTTSIKGYTQYTSVAADTGPSLTFAQHASVSTLDTRHKHSIFCVALTEAGGNIAATAIVPAVAGYTSHALVQSVWSPQTDAASSWTFAVAAGTIIGPSTFTLQLTANGTTAISAAVPNLYGPPIPLRGTIAADDNKNMTVAATGLPVVGTTYYIFGEYWYET